MEVIIFGSVQFLSKKVTKSIFFFEKKPKPVQTDWFRFGLIFLDKTGSNRLGSVFQFDSVFSVCLGFFRFQAYKTETKPVGFFKILIDFFSRFDFFGYFFQFNRFFGFFAHL